MENLDYLKIEGMFAGATKDVRKFAIKLRANVTVSENKLWEYLKNKPRGFKFRRQHPFSHYVLDFYCHELRLVIEIDGGYHLSRLQQEKDRNRTLEVAKYNVEVIRFTDKEVLGNYESVIAGIDSLLNKECGFRTL